MNVDPDQKDRLLPSEAAKMIGTSTTWVRFLVDTGRLPAERGTMGIRLLDRSAVLEFAEERRSRNR